MTDSSGNTCFNGDYYPYGQENDYDSSCSPTYKFTGYEYDSETGNYYAYARYYNPRLGRFMSPDPFGGDILNPQSLNRYTYVINNPATLTDPSGALRPLTYGSLMGVSLGIQEDSIQFGSNWNEFSVYETQSQQLQSLFKAGQVSATLLDAEGQFLGTNTSSQLYFVGNAFSPLGVVDLVYEQQVSYQILSSPSMPPGASSAAAPGPISGHPPQTQAPQSPQCTAAQRYAAQVGGVLQRTSEDFGLITAGGGLATAIFGVGEGATFGLDTAGTITAGAVTAFAGNAAFITGTAAAAFNSFANGNLNALSSFDLTRLAGLGATLAASQLPLVGRFAEQVGYAVEQATAAAQEAQGACQ